MAHPRVAARDQSALLVIDLQPALLKAAFRGDVLLANCELLLRAARELRIPVLATEQYPERLGATEARIRELLGGVTPVGKMCFSSYRAEPVTQELDRTGRSTVVLCGMETHVCVSQTAHDLLGVGYTVHVPRDAVSSLSEESWRAGLEKMRDSGVVLATTEMLVYEWLGSAGTPEFRRLLPFVKEAAARGRPEATPPD